MTPIIRFFLDFASLSGKVFSCFFHGSVDLGFNESVVKLAKSLRAVCERRKKVLAKHGKTYTPRFHNILEVRA